jgi:protein-tyrosine phosphatase
MRVWKIAPGLYQSPTPRSPQDVTFEDQDGHLVDISAIVDLEGDIDPDVPQREIGRVYLYWPIEDIDRLPDETTLRSVARFVGGLIDGGHRVLIHCRAGLNRASLLSGLALVERGMEPQEAVDLLRDRRDPTVLKNKTFLAWLLQQEPQPSRA